MSAEEKRRRDREHSRRYQKEHRAELLIKKRAYCAAHRAEKREYDRKRRIEKNAELRAYDAIRYIRDYDKIRSRQAKYMLNRFKKEPELRLQNRLRGRLRAALLGKTKWVSAVRDMGCSVQELKAYLENQFTPEMTWENYGKYWHVDHKAPLSAFNLQCPLQQWVAVQYTNLQPLEASENIRKRDSFDFDSFFRR